MAATRPVANNGLGLTPQEVIGESARLEKGFTLLPDQPQLLDEWKQLVVQHDCKGKVAHDARIVAAMKSHNIKHIMTFNGSDFRRYTDITIIDPNNIPAPSLPDSAS